jgi:excisionase family DNA binding protein
MYRTLENPKAPFPAYTTGEVAKICGISQGTIIRAFDRGTIGGFRVPGSRFRRITRRDLLNYMRTHGLEAHPEDHTVAVFAAVNDEIDEIVEIVRLIQALLERSNEHVTVHIADTMFDLGLALSGKNA